MPQVDIIVGSQMGSAEYVAEQLQEALEDQGFETVLHEQPNSSCYVHSLTYHDM